MGFLIYQRAFIKAIVDTFNRLLVSLDEKPLEDVTQQNINKTDNKTDNKPTSWASALSNLQRKIVTKL